MRGLSIRQPLLKVVRIIFVSDKFYFDGIHSDEKNICLASMDSGVINDYGINYNEDVVLNKSSKVSSYYSKGEEKIEDIILQMYYVGENLELLVWEDDVIQDVMDWLISDDFKQFVSEDNLELTYYFKTIKIIKKFTFEKKGYLEVTFRPFSNLAYKTFSKTFTVDTSKDLYFYNYSNVIDDYSPIIEIENLGNESNVISIANVTSQGEAFTITGLSNGEKVIVDNLIGTVVNSNGVNEISKCNRKWLRMNKDSSLIRFEGNAKITFKAQYPVRT